jgi:hypothetical protein
MKIKCWVVWDKRLKRIARGCGGRKPRIIRALKADAQNSMLFFDRERYTVRRATLDVEE